MVVDALRLLGGGGGFSPSPSCHFLVVVPFFRFLFWWVVFLGVRFVFIFLFFAGAGVGLDVCSSFRGAALCVTFTGVLCL